MSEELEKVELRQQRSFRQHRRRNDSDERPQSLISYDSRTSNSKVVVPPVLARARGSFPNEHYAMEKRSSLSALDDLVQCPICLDRLSQPKMLPCQHTFCATCLVDEFNNETTKNKSVIKCQVCGLKHELKDFNSLPDNMYIVSLLRIVNENKGSPIGTTPLMPDLQSRCVKCQTVCEPVDDRKTSNCCHHCLQTFCAICWDSHMVELNQQIKGFDNKLNSAIQKMNHKLEDGKVRHEKLAKQIRVVISGKVEELKQQQSKLLEESDNIANDAIDSHRAMIEKISSVKDTIEKCSSDPNLDKVDFFMAIHKEFSGILREIGLWGEEKSSLNEITLTIEMVDKTGQDEPSDELEALQEARKSVPEFLTNSLEGVEDYYRKKAFKARTLWTRCSRPSGVAIAPWTLSDNSPLLYIVGSDSKAVFVVDKNTGRYLQKITYEHMICPTGIAFSSMRDEIYVSDKWRHCIFVFSKTGQFLRFLGSKGDLEGYLRSPEGMTIGPNDTLFVCDTGNDRIQCLNAINGKMLMQFGMLKSEQLLNSVNTGAAATFSDLNSPTAVAIYNGIIIVLDSGNKRVKTFNQRGEKLNEFGQSGSLKGYFKYPEVMAIDSHGFILVGDGGNCKVQIFRNNGQFVTSIGTRGIAPGQFNWISGLTITDKFEIISSDYKNHTVQIFQ